MTSAINPNNIDGAYPVAGQDNNSQGFRDNFTNTKTNFQYAADEINDLQSKVVLKAALTGTALDNNMNGSLLSNAQIQDFSQTRVALGTLTGSVGVNYANGHYQTVTTGGSISLAFSNFSAAGTLSFLIVRVTISSTAHTLTLPAAVGTGSSAASVLGIEGFASNVITFAQTGTYEFQFHTEDGGSTVYLSELTRPRTNFSGTISVTGTATVGNITTSGTVSATGNIQGGNLNITGNAVAGNLDAVNLVINSISSDDSTFINISDGVNVNGAIIVTDTISTAGPLFVSSSEDLAASAAASLTKATSYFTTSAAETATLAAGTEGQIKTFAMVADGGNMVITVTNAGWKTSGTGTITFNDIGDACILQYINAKWFCTGSNGVAFA
jgi:hypothetical protein